MYVAVIHKSRNGMIMWFSEHPCLLGFCGGTLRGGRALNLHGFGMGWIRGCKILLKYDFWIFRCMGPSYPCHPILCFGGGGYRFSLYPMAHNPCSECQHWYPSLACPYGPPGLTSYIRAVGNPEMSPKTKTKMMSKGVGDMGKATIKDHFFPSWSRFDGFSPHLRHWSRRCIVSFCGSGPRGLHHTKNTS